MRFLDHFVQFLFLLTDRALSSEATEWLSNVLKENKLTKRQYYEMRGIWKSIEEYAFNDDLLHKRIILYLGNPADSLFANDPLKYAETAIFFPDEINLVSEKARELYHKSHFNTAYLGLALDNYLGFRVGELSCLRWDDIDYDRKYITIRQSEVSLYEVTEEGNIRNHGYEVVDHLKKGPPERGVPMPPEAEEVLDYIRSENEKHGIDSEYVFVQQNGDRVHTRAFHKAIKKVYAELGWTDYKIAGIHEFRRTYATTIIGKIDDKKVQGYMGHNDWGTTKRYYQIVKEKPDSLDAEAISRASQQA